MDHNNVSFGTSFSMQGWRTQVQSVSELKEMLDMSCIQASIEKMSMSCNGARLNTVGSGRARNDVKDHHNAFYRSLGEGE
jgi:hypothetical protein